MSDNLTIPAEVVPDLRESVFCLLGGAAEAILHTLEQPRREYHPEWFSADRRSLEDALILLDLAGWNAAEDAGALRVALAEHGAALSEALSGYLPLLEDQAAEADLDDERRAAEHRPLRKDELVERAIRLRDFLALLEQRLADLRR